jgi:hypothetical protein
MGNTTQTHCYHCNSGSIEEDSHTNTKQFDETFQTC